MKIQSSEMQFASNSQFTKASEETLYTLDDNGRVLNKTQQKITANRQSEASAYVRTDGDYTVEIRDEAMAESMSYSEGMVDNSVTPMDNLDKNLYMAYVFDWAADAIDQVMERFEEFKKVTLEEIAQKIGAYQLGNESALGRPKDGSNNDISIYKSLATELRAKAQALRPESFKPSDNRIRKISLHEKEETHVQASGVIKTADGQEINFSLDLGMKREAMVKGVESFRVVDPLVINFSGRSAELSDDKINFDLDGDGETEQVSRLKRGSGYLALDLNEDGIINSGKELFGPSTGDGFQELSFYDEDNNQWIDENDAIYDKLMVWTQEGSGDGALKKLSETGIGAIHLGSVDSGFMIENSSHEAVGQVVSTGVALGEDGSAKSVQQVDLLV